MRQRQAAHRAHSLPTVLFQGEFHSLLRAALDAIHVSHGAFICVFFIEHSYVCVFVCARVACVSTRIHVLSTRL